MAEDESEVNHPSEEDPKHQHHHQHHHKKHHHHHHKKKKARHSDPEGITADESMYESTPATEDNNPQQKLKKKRSKRASLEPEAVKIPDSIYQDQKNAPIELLTSNQIDVATREQELFGGTNKDGGNGSPAEDNNDEMALSEAPPDPLATIGEVFSFANTSKIKLCLMAGVFCASISGCAFPALAWVFADSFQKLSGINEPEFDFMKEMRELAYTLLVLGAITFTFMTLQAALLETAAGEMTENLRTKWFQALLRQDMAYFDITDVSGTATIININGKRYRKGLGRKLGEGVQFFITFVGGLVFGFWCSWRVSLVVLTVIPLMAASTAFLVKMNQTKTQRANSSYAKAGGIVYTAVSSLRTILALNAVEKVIEDFCLATQEALVGASSQVVWLGLANGAVMGSFLFVYLPLTLYGGYLLYDNVRETGCDPSGVVVGNVECDPDAFGVFGALMGMTFAGAVLPQVSATVESFTAARSACYPALVVMRRATAEKDSDCDKKQDSEDLELGETETNNLHLRRGSTAPLPKYVIDSSSDKGLKPKSVKGNISFNNVSFSYPTRQEVNVFDGFSLGIKAGQTVALCGPSGGGKSTTVQLIERFYDPKSGSISLDGHDLKDLNLMWLREHIGLVSQEPKLFAMTIAENIRVACPDASQEEIEEAAKKANAHDFITGFPDGYKTQVGDQGSAQLSGGQKQRIAIARVLIKKPKIILLDEATSALDSESEVIVQEALDNLMKAGDQTIIVIAHRLSTIRNADVIAVISGGKVVETGTHSSLIDRKGAYYGLIEAQKGNALKDDKSSSSGTERLSSRKSSVVADDDDEEEEVEETKDKKDVLRFRKVHFHYPSRPEQKIFRGLNLHVKEGETLALVGPSGQGKSTVIQLIENFYRPTKGVITYKGVNMKNLNTQWLRSEIGLVGQEPDLFDTSIEENIKFGMKREVSKTEIEEAAKEANAHDFIMSFPDGYQTNVGSSATQVSGGQKQRIAIARALLRKPKVLLLDEATSALDSESERVVQAALDKIMADKTKTTIVIAHRLSTIRNADRIAVIDHGKVSELGTHDELMAIKDGQYRRLQQLQSLDREAEKMKSKKKKKKNMVEDDDVVEKDDKTENDEEKKEREKKHSSKARSLSKGDEIYFIIGTVGAILAGLMFPGWGFAFAFMIELLYRPVQFCDEEAGVLPPAGFASCDDYWDATADDMKQLSIDITYGLIGILVAAVVGHTLTHYGFGTATERMNKRVRDASFKALIRQEVAWFDVRPVGTITSRLSDDAALIHSFSGEPIRQVALNLASVFVGLVVSFYYMWPFALMTLAILPFMAFGAEAEMQMYMGEDEGDDSLDDVDKRSAAGIVIESLLNIRTVASLALEKRRTREFVEALHREDPTPFRTNAIKGSTSGLGQLCQMWGIALMFWWGGWLIFNKPDKYDFREFNISMFSLLYGISGMGIAMQGATDREKAKAAAERIFELIERESEIDPLSTDGKKDGDEKVWEA